MEFLTELYADFTERLDEIAKIEGLNTQLVNIFENNLRSIKEEVEATGKFGGLLQKIDHQLQMLNQIHRLASVETNFRALREQSIVLAIGAMEVFFSDLFKYIANYRPDVFKWSNDKEKIIIDPELFKSGFTLGDVMITHLKNKQYSFQDTQSIIKAIENYFGVLIQIDDDTKRHLIAGTSLRHIIVHNRSLIDRQFKSQTRDIGLFTSQNINDRVEIDEYIISDITQSIKSFCEDVVTTLIQNEEINSQD